MGFVMGSSCLIQSSFTHQSLLLPSSSSSSSSSSSQPFFFCSHIKNVKKNRLVAMASLPHENPNETNLCKRRAVVILGISILPFLQLKARAAEGLMKEERDVVAGENQIVEKLHGDAPQNPVLSLLNAVGIIGSGVLGALYTLAQKEKTATEATIKSLKNKLIEKEALKDSLEKNFEKKLIHEQEERAKQIKKANEEQLSLSNKLASANSTITGLRKEIQTEKRFVEELNAQIGNLQTKLSKAGEDKNLLEKNLKEKLDSIEVLQDRVNLLSLEIKDKESNLQKLNSSLAEKDLECKNLSSMYNKAKADLAEANADIKGLKEENLKTRKELDIKNSEVDDLNAKVTVLVAERDDINRRFESLQEDYSDLKSSSEKKSAVDAELLAKREHELNQLEQKLGIALKEVNDKQILVSDLTQDRDDLRKMLEFEVKNVENLRNELRVTEETLHISKVEASDLSTLLEQSQKLSEELSLEISRNQAEFAKAQELLKKNLEEVRSNSEVLSNELASVKTVVKQTKEELRIVSDKLAAAVETTESLKKELVDAYRKAENSARDVEAERKTVSSLRKEIEASKKQILSDKEARRNLEMDLEKATNALEEVNKNILILSRERDIANSRVGDLQDEKDMLYKSLMEQKSISNEARENVEDAHNLIMRLGQERESLEKRVIKLDDELGAAKGEILRLRNQINSSKVLEAKEQEKRSKKSEGNNVVTAKKTSRRRKTEPLSESS